MQDRCMRISCARCLCQVLLSRTTCARSLYADLLRISLCQDLCIRILYDHLCKISVCGSLAHISLSGSLQQDPVGARSLHQDLLCEISLSGSLQTACRRPPFQITQTQLYQHSARWKRTISAEGHTVTLGNQKSQLYQHFTRWTNTISAEGCTSKSEITTLPSFCAMDTCDLRKELHFEIRNRNCTSISCDGHARSPQRVALRTQKTQLYLHSVHSTRTISAEGSHLNPNNATLPAFRALDTQDLRRGLTFRNHASKVLRLPRNHEPMSHEMRHWPRKSIPKLKFQKRNPSHELSPLASKYRIHGADSLAT